jgi:hypothetical protein
LVLKSSARTIRYLWYIILFRNLEIWKFNYLEAI